MKKFKSFGSTLILGVMIATLLGFFAFPAFTQMIGGGMIGNTFSGGPVANPILLPDGTAAAPSLTSAGFLNYGIYFSSGYTKISMNSTTPAGVPLYNAALGLYGWFGNYFDVGGWEDTLLSRAAANTLALKNANNDQKFRTYGANGSYYERGSQSELLTIAAAATTTTTMTIPANAKVSAVAVYVVTVIPTAATFTVIGNTSTTAFNTAAVGVAAGSNDPGTENTPYKNGAAQTIRITPNATPGAATGQVRVVLFYEVSVAPTS